MNEFLEKSDNEGFNGKAACFNYKNKLEIPRKCTEGVNFKELGFPGNLLNLLMNLYILHLKFKMMKT